MISSNREALEKQVLALFAARRGHFRFESGHHGDLSLEIPPAYVDPKRLRRYAAELARPLAQHRVEAVCGPLVEGAFLAQMVAEEMGAEFYFAEQFTRASGNGLYPIGYRIPGALRRAIRGKRTAVVRRCHKCGVGGAWRVQGFTKLRSGTRLRSVRYSSWVGRHPKLAASKNVH